MTPAERAVAGLREATGGAPQGVWRAPGRVNLIGEHTDYNGGLALPFALEQAAVVAARRREDDLLVLTALDRGTARLRVGEVVPGRLRGWQAHVAGPAWALRERGVGVGGAELVLASDVPEGAGVSSSAAIGCAVTLALAGLAGARLEPLEVARVAQRSESEVVGAPTGLLDQVASVASTRGHAVLVDFADLRAEALQPVPFDVAGAGLALLVVDTRVQHEHSTGGYGDVRAACERAARVLEVGLLGEADIADLPGAAAELGADLRVARHVLSEDARVRAAVSALRAGDVAAVGPLLQAGQASLREDLRTSVPAIDSVVRAALTAGALGARMTGGGFGGSVVVLCPVEVVQAVGEAVRAAQRDGGHPELGVLRVAPGEGAGAVGGAA